MNVLCVMAHPDDEVLGCGGTLAKHAEAGDSVNVMILADRELHEEIRAAGRALGYGEFDICLFDFPDQKFDGEPLADIAHVVQDRTAGIGGKRDPDIVYTHHPGDLNLDHALTARAVLTAFRPKPGEKPRTILACEVLSSTEWTFPQTFQPNWFEALTASHLVKKVDAMRCYPSEIQPAPHPRNHRGIRNQAMVRGQQAGTRFAEAFQLLRRGPC